MSQNSPCFLQSLLILIAKPGLASIDSDHQCLGEQASEQGPGSKTRSGSAGYTGMPSGSTATGPGLSFTFLGSSAFPSTTQQTNTLNPKIS